jgi:hypothetical protein
MGQQLNKTQKRRRRVAYLKRKSVAAKTKKKSGKAAKAAA